MSERCAKCSAELPVGAGRCPQCGVLVKPPGLLERLFGKFKFSFNVSTRPGSLPFDPHFSMMTTVNQTYKVQNQTTGEIKEYHSLADVPAADREVIRKFMKPDPADSDSCITYMGPDGVKRIYKSMDELPDEYWLNLSKARPPGTKVSHLRRYSYTGPDGVTHTYNSLDEMPPDVRAMMEKARRSPESK